MAQKDQHRLHINLGSVFETRYVSHAWLTDLRSIWPQPDDPRWDHEALDDYVTDDELRTLAERGLDLYRPGRLLEIAASEGLRDLHLVNSPEEALMALYVAWSAAEANAFDASLRFQREHLPPSEEWWTISASRRAEIIAHPDYPFRDMDHVDHLAEEILELFGNHPIADHARLARLQIATRAGMEDVAALDDEARRRLEDSVLSEFEGLQTDKMRTFAALQITEEFNATTRDGRSDVAHALRDVHPADPEDDLRLTTWAAAQSVASGDWSEAQFWTARLDAALKVGCSRAPSSRCTQRVHQLLETRSRLVFLGWTDAQDWREELVAKAWSCHATEQHRGMSNTFAEWDVLARRWRFDTWEHPTSTTRCMSSIGATRHEPSTPVTVRISLEGPE